MSLLIFYFMLKIFRASCHRCSQMGDMIVIGSQSSLSKLPNSHERCLDGGSPRTTNWNPGVFLEPRGAHLPRYALSLSTTTTTSPKICSRIVLCSPREEILLCEILLCGSWQSRADGWAVVMNYKSYCYRGATAAAEGDLRITPLLAPTATTDPYSD